MEFTNKYNLPQHIVDWLTSDDYDYINEPNTISTTSLMKPVRAHWLVSRHADNLQTDVYDRVASRMGSAIHDAMDKCHTEGLIKEERHQRQLDVDGVTWNITGKFDLLVNNQDGTWHLRDIKTTSVWAYILGGKDIEYTKQMSVYRWLLQDKYEIADEGYIDFLFTDWQSSKAKTDPDYPQLKIQHSYPVPLWSLDKTEEYILERVSLIQENQEVEDNKLPYCTREELWAKDDQYAVKKIGNQKATRVFDSEAEALNYIHDKKLSSKAKVEKRPAQVKRCKYCPALPFCNQGTYYLNSGRVAL